MHAATRAAFAITMARNIRPERKRAEMGYFTQKLYG
jgi:hypothetical protein